MTWRVTVDCVTKDDADTVMSLINNACEADVATTDDLNANGLTMRCEEVPLTQAQTSTDTSHLLIARINGKSATRRQRRFPDRAAIDRAVKRWGKEGYNTFWHYPPDGEVRQWNTREQ